MKITVDTNDRVLSPNEQVLLEMLKRGENDKALRFVDKYCPSRSIQNQLQDYMGNLKFHKKIMDYDRDLQDVKLNTHLDEVKLWIALYRKKWPTQQNRRGSLTRCLSKMKDFMADNPQYSKEQIFAAADKLLSEHIGELRYLIKADNFIYKNGHSTLLSYLEDMGEEWEMYNSTDDMA